MIRTTFAPTRQNSSKIRDEQLRQAPSFLRRWLKARSSVLPETKELNCCSKTCAGTEKLALIVRIQVSRVPPRNGATDHSPALQRWVGALSRPESLGDDTRTAAPSTPVAKKGATSLKMTPIESSDFSRHSIRISPGDAPARVLHLTDIAQKVTGIHALSS
jgi:hypothetical protein